MAEIVKKVINQINVGDESLFDNEINITKATRNTLNNLDDVDDNVGTFNVKIFGIGGAGCNVISHMYQTQKWSENIGLYALNTDIKALRKNLNTTDVNLYLLGKQMLRGAGSGGDPEIGRLSVQDSIQDIKQALTNTDLLFIVAGLGKGTGSGASPEIARIARELGILTVAIVNLPSIHAEGQNVFKNALDSYEILRKEVDSITTISNDKIINKSQQKISFIKAFEQANIEVANVIGEIVNMIDNASEMNIDFADIRNFFKKSPAFMANTISFNETYSPKALRASLDTCFKNSCSDVEIKNESTRVLASFTICATTAASIVADARAIFRELAGNNNLTLVPGVSYETKEGVKLSFLISASSQALDQEQIKQYDEIHTIAKPENEIDLIDLLTTNDAELDEYRTAKMINKAQGVVHQQVTFGTAELEEMSNSLDSREADAVINKAMTNVIQNKMTEQKKESN